MPKKLIDTIETNLFVRNRLDQDWAIQLAELLDAGTSLSPIKITQNNFYPEMEKKWLMVDGRHRIEAHLLLNLTEIDYEIVQVRNEQELIALAYKSNLGGSLPPRKEDTEHTVRLLIERKVLVKDIAEMLGLPASITRKFVTEIKSKDKRAKEMRAVAAVTEGGLTIPKAAEQYDADEDRVREILGGRGRKHAKGIEETQRTLTALQRSHSQKVAKIMKALSEKYEDGDVSGRQVAAILDHVEASHKNFSRRIVDWKKRFAATGVGPKKKNGVEAHAS